MLHRMSQLKVSTRFMLLGAVALVLAALPSAMYLHAFYSSTQAAYLEVRGIAPSKNLLALMQLVQRHRGLSIMVLNGHAEVQSARLATGQEIDALFSQPSSPLARAFDEPGQSQAWARSADNWHALHVEVSGRQINAQHSFDRHTRLIGQLFDISNRLNYEFGFATDRERQTRALIDVALTILPALTEELGKARVVGASMLGAHAASAVDRRGLGGYLSLAEYQQSRLTQAVSEAADANPALESVLFGPMYEAADIAQQAVSLARSQLIYRSTSELAAPDYFTAFSRAIDAQFALSHRVMDQLESLLNERAAHERLRLLLMLVAMLVTLGLGLGVGAAAALSITRQLGGEPGEVTAVAKAVASGDLSSNIKVVPSAEHSILAAMNNMQAALRVSKERYQRLIDSMPLGVMITQNGFIKFCNPMTIEMLGYAADELIGKPFLPMIHEDDRAHVLQVHTKRMRGEIDLADYGVRVIRRDGVLRYWQLLVQTVEWDGAPAGLSILTDNTERKATETQLRELSSIVEQTNDAIMLTAADGTIKYINPGYERLSGYCSDEVLGKTPALFKSDAQDKHFFRLLWETISAGKPFQCQIVNRHKDGSEYHVLKTITPTFDADGAIASYVNIDMDFSAQHEAQQRIAYQALHDKLTGLPNRSLLGDRIVQTIARDQREPSPFALLFIDLDGFKVINDHLGHQVGDDVLLEVARRMQQGTRSMDTVARIGGDEFVVLLQGVHEAEQAALTGYKLISAIREPLQVQDQTCQLGASVGLSLYPTDATNLEALLDIADVAMYRAKRAGGNRMQHGKQALADPNPQLEPSTPEKPDALHSR